MPLFTDMISQIRDVQALRQVSATLRPVQTKELIQNSILDTVTFSTKAKSLFEIGEIDRFFDATFGIPATLGSKQQEQLRSIQKALQTRVTQNGSLPEYAGLSKEVRTYLRMQGIESDDTEGMSQLQEAIKSYVIGQSVNHLFGDTASQATFTSLGNGSLQRLLLQTLDNQERQDLGRLSLQLNRLFFTGVDDNFTALLREFNQLYGLQEPDEEALFEASGLFARRNALLAQTRLDRNDIPDYGNLTA